MTKTREIKATLEVDVRKGLFDLFKGTAATESGTVTFGGSPWTGTAVSSTSTTTLGSTIGWSYGTGTALYPAHPKRLSAAQRAMVIDAIAEQLVNPSPDASYHYYMEPPGGSISGSSFYGGGTVTGMFTKSGTFSVDLAAGESTTLDWSYDET